MEELAELQIKVLLTRICFAARCSENQRDQNLVIPQSVDRLSSYSYSMHFYAYIIYIALAYCVEKSILRVSCRCSHAVNSVWTFSRKKPDWRSSFRTARSCKLNDIYILYYIILYCIILYYIVLYYSIFIYIYIFIYLYISLYIYIFIYLYISSFIFIYLYALLQYAPELCFHLGYGNGTIHWHSFNPDRKCILAWHIFCLHCKPEFLVQCLSVCPVGQDKQTSSEYDQPHSPVGLISRMLRGISEIPGHRSNAVNIKW